MKFSDYVCISSTALHATKLVAKLPKCAAFENLHVTSIISPFPWYAGTLTIKSIAVKVFKKSKAGIFSNNSCEVNGELHLDKVFATLLDFPGLYKIIWLSPNCFDK